MDAVQPCHRYAAQWEKSPGYNSAPHYLHILLIADDSDFAAHLRRLLTWPAEGLSISLTHVKHLDRALSQLQERPFDAVMLDLALAAACYQHIFNLVRLAVPTLPLLLITTMDNHATALLGAHDETVEYLYKEHLNTAELLAALRRALDQQHTYNRMIYFALHDPLTGLANRTLLYDRLTQALIAAQDYGDPLAVLCINLNGFTEISDRYGSETRDELLCEVAERLMAYTRESDTVARLADDEFVIVLPRSQEIGAQALCRRLNVALASPYALEIGEYRITANIGVATRPADGMDASVLLITADNAKDMARKQQSDTFPLYRLSPTLGG